MNYIKDLPILKTNKKAVPLFYPHIPKKALKGLKKVLSSRWIGQGPLVDKFEKIFSKRFCDNIPAIAVGSGTDGLHLSYILANLKRGDEVICPVFTCTATNLPLLYMGIKIKFADVDPRTLNININSVEKLINRKTKAIVFVNYGGIIADLKKLNELKKKHNLVLIQDAAQSLGAKYNKKSICNYADFTIFSFQAIKHITSADGGALVVKNKKLVEKAKRIRWFGIDKKKKLSGIWENDIKEIGYKYQLNDLGASILLESIKEFNLIKNHRNKIFSIYKKNLKNNKNLKLLDNTDKNSESIMWLATIVSDYKDLIQKKLRIKKIETNQVHFRNDKYSIFKKYCKNIKFVNMNNLEKKYLLLPIHTKMTIHQARYIADQINKIFEKI